MGVEGEEQVRLNKRLSILVVVLIGVVAVLAAAWIILQWSIAESVYSLKAGLNWFGITFYSDYTFVVGALFALLLIYPSPGKSDLWKLFTVMYRRTRPYTEEGEAVPSEKLNIWLWVLWQTIKWALGFYGFVSSGAFILLGPIMNPIRMMIMGLGSWADIPRVLSLPVAPATGSGFVDLMPTLSIQYAVLSYVVTAVLLIAAIRVFLRLLANLATRRSDIWLRNLLTLV
ncbi:MAG TPA: hypothetical protein VEC92_02170, partial [Nitrososphaerales archaeon]|nr:hypothetical protein [Nitrososphaerales archaeon]